MTRMKLNLLALGVVLAGAFTLSVPAQAMTAEEAVVCCPGDGGSCCGDECKSKSDGSCSACSGWRCWFF